MVATGFLVVGAFLVGAGALGVREAPRIARVAVAADPFEGDHPGGDDPVAWATSLARWVAAGVALLGLGVAGAGLLF